MGKLEGKKASSPAAVLRKWAAMRLSHRHDDANAVLNAAGIPIVRFQANAIPSAGDLRNLLLGEQSSVVVTQGRQHGAKVEPTISMP